MYMCKYVHVYVSVHALLYLYVDALLCRCVHV